MILGADPRSPLDANTMTDEKIDRVKAILTTHQMHVSAFQVTQNHISADPTQRTLENDYFVKAIELAGNTAETAFGPAQYSTPTTSLE